MGGVVVVAPAQGAGLPADDKWARARREAQRIKGRVSCQVVAGRESQRAVEGEGIERNRGGQVAVPVQRSAPVVVRAAAIPDPVCCLRPARRPQDGTERGIEKHRFWSNSRTGPTLSLFVRNRLRP